MSGLILHLRLAYWHLQVGRARPWLRMGLDQYRWDRGCWRPLYWVGWHPPWRR